MNPVGTSALLVKLLPLISDSSTPVRTQLLKLLRILPEDEVKCGTEHAVMFVRAGMTNLSADISNDALSAMEWLLEVAQDELVASPGGWVKTLSTFCAMMGWAISSSSAGWTSSSRTTLRTKDAQTLARQITILTKFLQAGFKSEAALASSPLVYWENMYKLPRSSNAFDYLNLFGSLRDEEGEMYPNRDARQKVFHRRFLDAISIGVDKAKKEGGATGRAAVGLDQVLKKGMGDYEPSTAMETQDLLDLW